GFIEHRRLLQWCDDTIAAGRAVARDELSGLSYPSPSSGRAGWGLLHGTELCATHPTRPRFARPPSPKTGRDKNNTEIPMPRIVLALIAALAATSAFAQKPANLPPLKTGVDG